MSIRWAFQHFQAYFDKKDGYRQRNVRQFLRHIIWLRQESLRHILASPGYAPGTIAVNVTWMERGFNACQTHRSMYPSIFNRFPVIQPVSSKVRHFSIFLHILASPGYAPGTIAVNVTRLEKGFNACKTPRCIYLSIVNHFWDIGSYWSKIAIFSHPTSV